MEVQFCKIWILTHLQTSGRTWGSKWSKSIPPTGSIRLKQVKVGVKPDSTAAASTGISPVMMNLLLRLQLMERLDYFEQAIKERDRDSMVDHLKESNLSWSISDALHNLWFPIWKVNHRYQIMIWIAFGVGEVKLGVWWVVEDVGNSCHAWINQAFHSEFRVVKFLQLFITVIFWEVTDTGSICCHDFVKFWCLGLGRYNGVGRNIWFSNCISYTPYQLILINSNKRIRNGYNKLINT